eukprot:Sspe_Gene.62538::Locus_35179_Transcript_1_1_Confidence_1.000_Length_773::g.62538::m.62538
MQKRHKPPKEPKKQSRGLFASFCCGGDTVVETRKQVVQEKGAAQPRIESSNSMMAIEWDVPTKGPAAKYVPQRSPNNYKINRSTPAFTQQQKEPILGTFSRDKKETPGTPTREGAGGEQLGVVLKGTPLRKSNIVRADFLMKTDDENTGFGMKNLRPKRIESPGTIEAPHPASAVEAEEAWDYDA